MVLKSVNITLNIMDKKIMEEALASELQEIKGGSALSEWGIPVST